MPNYRPLVVAQVKYSSKGLDPSVALWLHLVANQRECKTEKWLTTGQTLGETEFKVTILMFVANVAIFTGKRRQLK